MRSELLYIYGILRRARIEKRNPQSSLGERGRQYPFEALQSTEAGRRKDASEEIRR